MMKKKRGQAELSQAISPDEFETKFGKYLDTEVMRLKIISVLKEEIEKVSFSNLVKKYAGEEMDSRLFRSARYWALTALTAVITGAISAGIALFLRAQ
jgi:hypothetical protein